MAMTSSDEYIPLAPSDIPTIYKNRHLAAKETVSYPLQQRYRILQVIMDKTVFGGDHSLFNKGQKLCLSLSFQED